MDEKVVCRREEVAPFNNPAGVTNTWLCADGRKQRAREGKEEQQATSYLILSDGASPQAARLRLNLGYRKKRGLISGLQTYYSLV
jgi:hypothetical protein